MKSHVEGPPVAELGVLLEDYRYWLVTERCLASSTVRNLVKGARLFLSEFDGRDLGSLTVRDVSGFMVGHSSRLSVESAKRLAGSLRSLLSYLYVEGFTDRQLATAVPAPSGPHGTSLPRWLSGDDLAALVAVGRDVTTPRGVRNHAIVVILARLGLRAGEAAALSLDDVDWRAGDIAVRGKGDRVERLPLPVDVGEALVAYLEHGRPPAADRALFVGARRPWRGLSYSTIWLAVNQACAQAGIAPVGAHRLRHSAATAMLRAGASLEEVAQVLRQRSTQVTALYAKVDFVALRTLAMPWPGVRP
jgi:site-specific recombinase XerD